MLSRGAYIDCLLSESNRARSQSTPVSLVVIQIDRGGELLRLHGESVAQPYLDQVWHALSSTVRQTDVVVKYTASSLVFILPDTSYENAKKLAEKLRQIALAIRPPWGEEVTISAGRRGSFCPAER